jgi:hypothetical protein
MQASTAALRARNLRTLGLLAALFLMPLALAFFTYYGSSWRPGRTVNHGLLISPARALSPVSLPQVLPAPAGAGQAPVLFRERWSLVYVGSGACEADCRDALFVMRAARLALNNDMTRVAQVFLVTADCCAREFLTHEHPGVRVLDAQGAAAEPLLRAFGATDRAHTLFVVDPLGNLMMRYDSRRNPRGLLDDLKKLLSLSHIG